MEHDDFNGEDYSTMSDEELAKLAGSTEDIREDKPWQEEDNKKYDEKVEKLVKEKNRRTEAAKQQEGESNFKYFIRKYKKLLITLGVIVFIVLAFALWYFFTHNFSFNGLIGNSDNSGNGGTKEPEPTLFYDNLTGKEIVRTGIQYNADGSEKKNDKGETIRLTEMQAKEYANNYNNKPLYCIQTPNGIDGGRPQISLNQASVVFEAIAEAGITRFAAIYKDIDNLSVIGPVRSLRTYYLQWDTPFDCMIIHAGGEDGALEAVASYNHLSESDVYMWRDYSAYWAPNNLFTSGTLLQQFANDNGITSSKPKVFARMTPSESYNNFVDIRTAKAMQAKANTEDQSSEAKKDIPEYEYANNINFHFTSAVDFNVNYTYDANTNSYLRSYESGDTHDTYTCQDLAKSGSNIAPQSDCGPAVQINPDVVIGIYVAEQLNQVNRYREDITTVGSGDAYIFQNGIAIKATWHKATVSDQISWTDEAGNEIKLAPGKTWISAIPESYGSISFSE